ncbi:MAG: methyltransferase domain-containing protein [Phycisphaerales bacterium]
MSTSYDEATQIARDYYNSSDADRFYEKVWGGEDIHIGIYNSGDEPIREASERTVEHMLTRLVSIHHDADVLDIGSGYGGAARRIAKRFGCNVTCVNLSEAENDRNRELCRDAGLADQIDVIDGSFEKLDVSDASIDVVWCQDAILHSGDRAQVLREVGRVLKPGGRFIFTDPMQSDECPDGVLDPILQRIHLPDLGSPGFYKEQAHTLGWENLGYEDMTTQLVNHYGRVREMTIEMHNTLVASGISEEYLERMKGGLSRWVEGGDSGWLAWGIFLFQKPVKPA